MLKGKEDFIIKLIKEALRIITEYSPVLLRGFNVTGSQPRCRVSLSYGAEFNQ